ncbi:MAG: putative lipid II flippase FtsW [Clostridiaceae bacterium]
MTSEKIETPMSKNDRTAIFGKGSLNGEKLFSFSLEKADKRLILVLILLVSFGLVMGISTSSYTLISRGESIQDFMVRQIGFVAAGIFVMYFISCFNYHLLGKTIIWVGLPVVVLLNILPRLTGTEILGAYRWFRFGGIQFQPSELAKYFIVAFAAYLLSSSKGDKDKLFKNYLWVLGVGALFAGIVLIAQNNLSTAAIIFLITIIIIAISGLKPISWIMPFTIGLVGGVVSIFSTDYRRARVLGFLDPFKDPSGDTMQLVQSLYALASGGLIGRGLGNSRLKAFWLPFAENDFIFAIICEELGLIGGLCVMAALGYLVYRGLKIAREAPDLYGKLLATGITSVIALQSLINMAVVMGAFPVTGVPLPFISLGGTSLIMNLAAMGILINISKQSRFKRGDE